MRPLDGMVVIDLCRFGPGRYCTMLLADFGARVITIETPQKAFQLSTVLTDDTSPRYMVLNRNKKSMTLNLREKEGKEVFYQLAQKADVLVEAFRPGVTKRLGIDYETLSQKNPRLVYCSITGFGQYGPRSQSFGHDPTYVSLSGIHSLTGARDGPPTLQGTTMADLGGGFSQAVMGILLALFERGKSGKGQYVDISMLDGLISWLWVDGMSYLLTGEIPRRGGTVFTGCYPGWNIYLTKDSEYLTLGCYEPESWERLCQVLGREDFKEYFNADQKKYDEMKEIFVEIIKGKSRDEWLSLLEKTDVPCAPVNDVAQAFSDPQVICREMVVGIEHPVLGKVRQIGIPIKLSRTPGRILSPPPRYGEHTEEILGDIGYSEDDIAKFRGSKIID